MILCGIVMTETTCYKSFDDLVAELDESERNKTLLDKVCTLIKYRLPYVIESTCWDLKAFYQRGRTGVADVDWWNLNNHVAHVILRGVTKLIDEGTGYPSSMTPEEWRQILLKIQSAMVLTIDIDENCNYRCLTDEENKQIEEAFTLIGKYFWYLWD